MNVNNTPITEPQLKNALTNCVQLFEAYQEICLLQESHYNKGIISMIEKIENEFEALQMTKAKCGNVMVNLFFNPSNFEY